MDESRPLHEEINKTTRKLHTELNRLVVFYLPLAVPPAATSPQAYASGIKAFAQVYYTFENLWVEELQIDRDHAADLEKNLTGLRPDGNASSQDSQARVRDVLRRLFLPNLMRTRALMDDLAYLDRECMNGETHASSTTYASPQAQDLQAFVSHIRLSITGNPHRLLAYAWIFYMALFSGGRWIRAQLYAAGPEFWAQQSQQKSNGGVKPNKDSQEVPTAQYQGLSFFHFPGDEDGEDIKRDFKARFAEVEHHLTVDERRDMVAESVRIFEFAIAMVQELDSSDRQQGSPRLSQGRYRQTKSSMASVQGPVLSPLANLVSVGQASGAWSTFRKFSYLVLLLFGYLALRRSIASLLSNAS
ncbi:MAG: hypothetical protein M1823_005996 [Watsoniomyces obsoletus]|nr:MAG: hypothetical protein M1823_005996 [Watsoniomyces obsoletus]